MTTFLRDSRNRKRGMTLMELAIVLLVIGLIAGLLTPLIISTAKRSKVRQGKQGLEAMVLTVTGQIMSDSQHSLPDPSDALFDVSDVWGRAYGYFPAPSLDGRDICAETDASRADLALVTATQTVNNVAFVLTSDGPDHEARITSAPGQVDVSDHGDDLYAYLSLYQLYKIVCGKDS